MPSGVILESGRVTALHQTHTHTHRKSTVHTINKQYNCRRTPTMQLHTDRHTHTCITAHTHTLAHKQKFNNLSINTVACLRTPTHTHKKTDSRVNAHRDAHKQVNKHTLTHTRYKHTLHQDKMAVVGGSTMGIAGRRQS